MSKPQVQSKLELSRSYTFYLTANVAEVSNFEDAIKSIGTFHTVEDFWAIYQHLIRSDDLPPKIDYNMVPFVGGIVCRRN